MNDNKPKRLGTKEILELVLLISAIASSVGSWFILRYKVDETKITLERHIEKSDDLVVGLNEFKGSQAQFNKYVEQELKYIRRGPRRTD